MSVWVQWSCHVQETLFPLILLQALTSTILSTFLWDVPLAFWWEGLWYSCPIYSWCLHRHVFSALWAIVNFCIHYYHYSRKFLLRGLGVVLIYGSRVTAAVTAEQGVVTGSFLKHWRLQTMISVSDLHCWACVSFYSVWGLNTSKYQFVRPIMSVLLFGWSSFVRPVIIAVQGLMFS